MCHPSHSIAAPQLRVQSTAYQYTDLYGRTKKRGEVIEKEEEEGGRKKTAARINKWENKEKK